MICGAESRAYCDRLSFGENWSVRQCLQCGHGFVSNRPTHLQLQAIYASDVHLPLEEPDLALLQSQADAKDLARRVSSLCDSRGRSLDVGSGSGGFSYYLAREGFTPFMIDLDPRAAKWAALVPGACFELCSIEAYTDPEPFDVIVMSQVLEHALNPMEWLRRASRLLSPDGVLAIALPNFGGVYHLLGARDPFLIPPIHLNFFTPTSLRLAFRSAGLDARVMRSRSRVHVPKGLPMRSFILRRAWNAVCQILDPTSRGIVLTAFAKLAAQTLPAGR
jgi:SAM-dependent methyltransferase